MPLDIVVSKILAKGAFNNYVDRTLPLFDPPPLRGQFLYPEREQNKTFFGPLPPHLVHVVIKWPLIVVQIYQTVMINENYSKYYFCLFIWGRFPVK